MINTVLLSLFIYLVLAVPMFVFADRVLSIWLAEVPERTIAFVRIVLIIGVAAVFDDCFYTAISANGQMAGYTLMVCIADIVVFGLTWVLICLTGNPYIAAMMIFVRTCIGGFFIVPTTLKRVVGYVSSDFYETYIPSARVLLGVVAIGAVFWYVTPAGIMTMFISGGVCAVLVAMVCWFVGVPKDIRRKLIALARERFLTGKI